MQVDKYGFITLEKGEKKGIFTVEKLSKKTKDGRYWYCKCECGAIKEITSSNFRKGSGTSKCNKCGRGAKKSHNNKSVGELTGIYWRHLILAAKQRNIEFDITIEEAWQLFLNQNKKCKLSGKDLFMGFWDRTKQGRNKNVKGTASLDRIDSNKPYTIENCQWIHKDINWIKNKLDQDYFLEICANITDYQRNKNANQEL